MAAACAAVCADMEKAARTWEAIQGKDLVEFNSVLEKNGLKAIVIAGINSRAGGRGAR